MLKLIHRDLFIYQRRNLFILPLYALLFVFIIWHNVQVDNSGFALSIIVISLFGVTVTANTAFAYDESLKFNKYLRALPVTPEAIVLSRYAACLLSAISGAVFVVLSAVLANIISVYNPVLYRDMSLGIEGFIMWIFVLVLLCGILMPILFKFGYIKAKYPIMLLIIALGASGPMILSSTGINQVLSDALSFIGTTGGYIIVFIVSLLALYGSVKLSISIFKNKEE